MVDWKAVGVGEQLSRDEDLFGVLAIDKPASMTSRDVVNRVQRLLRTAQTFKSSSRISEPDENSPPKSRQFVKVGHTGTLDPMATGVLLLVVGQATRLVEYSHDLPKTYEAEFTLGLTSNTLDSTGQIQLISSAPTIGRQQLMAELQNWQGPIRQQPPKVSAVHIGGHRAYEMARKGIEFEVPTRVVTIHRLELMSFEFPRFVLRVQCSTGTYIRSLGADIATALGSGAVMSRLVRTEIGPFRLVDCVSLGALQSKKEIVQSLRPPLDLLQQMMQIKLEEVDCQSLRQGKKLRMDQVNRSFPGQDGQQAVAVDVGGRPVAIVLMAQGLIRPIRVFNIGGECH